MKGCFGYIIPGDGIAESSTPLSIERKLRTDPMAVDDMDRRRRGKWENPVSKH